MPLYQSSVLQKYLDHQDEAVIKAAYQEYTAYFHDPKRQAQIRALKEEQFQEGFLGELKKQKVKLSLEEEAEWMDYFTKKQTEAHALLSEIDRLDREIDEMVYELYGLTEEEVKVVEGT